MLPQISQPYQFEFANINLGQDEVAVDFLNNVMGLSQAAGQEFGGWIYNADNGGFGLSLSVGNAAKVDIYTPDNALSQLGKGLNDTTAMWHTHVNRNDSSASLADTYIAGHFERDSYIASHATNATVINKLDTHTIAERASSGRINTSNLSIGANITSQRLSNGNRIVNVSTANGDYSVAALANAGYVYGSVEGLEEIKDLLSDDLYKVELEMFGAGNPDNNPGGPGPLTSQDNVNAIIAGVVTVVGIVAPPVRPFALVLDTVILGIELTDDDGFTRGGGRSNPAPAPTFGGTEVTVTTFDDDGNVTRTDTHHEDGTTTSTDHTGPGGTGRGGGGRAGDPGDRAGDPEHGV